MSFPSPQDVIVHFGVNELTLHQITWFPYIKIETLADDDYHRKLGTHKVHTRSRTILSLYQEDLSIPSEVGVLFKITKGAPYFFRGNKGKWDNNQKNEGNGNGRKYMWLDHAGEAAIWNVAPSMAGMPKVKGKLTIIIKPCPELSLPRYVEILEEEFGKKWAGNPK